VASGKSRNRPLRAIITLVLALGAAVADHVAGIALKGTSPRAVAGVSTRVSVGVGHLITICASIAFVVFATVSVFAFSSWTRDALERFVGAAYGAIVRYAMLLIGLSVVIVTALSMLGFRVGQLVLGGAVTGVLLTIAAQQSLSNVFAGVMLQFSHPFRVGDNVRIRSGALAGTIEGTVIEFTITYVLLTTDDGPIFLPNSQVLAAAVSPVRPVNGGDASTTAGLP
jgi:small-conductance mechanosensitive channel